MMSGSVYYQKRVPEVLIQNENLNEEFYQLLEEEKLDEKATEKLEKEFSTELEVIKRDDRLDTIAKDIVEHFPSRGYLGKGMVISVDKFTSIKMYDKVQKHWKEEIKILVGLVNKCCQYKKLRPPRRSSIILRELFFIFHHLFQKSGGSCFSFF
jgi:type I restriction enzyme R subunit